MDYKLFISRAIEAGFSDIEVYATSSIETNISIFNGEVDKTHSHDDTSIGIRAILDGKMAYINTSNSNEDFDYLLNALKDNATSLTTNEEFEIFSGSKSYPVIESIDGGFSKVNLADKIDLLINLEKEIMSYDARMVNVPHCSYGEEIETISIINSKGLDLKKTKEYGYILAQAVAKDNDQTASSFEIEVKNHYRELDPIIVGQRVAKKTIEKLNADSLESKVYPVIFDNESMADLFSVFTSFFSGEAAIKKLSPLVGKEGELLFSEKLSIIDDPLNSEAINKEPFDDEGFACYKKKVVDKGVFKTMLHNLKTAKYYKTTSTGNGFRSGGTIGVRGTNLYIEAGKSSKEELISSIKEGLLITDLAGLHAGANPVTGDFSCQSSGFLIKDGKLDRPITLIVVSGNFLTLMKQIEELGSDLKIFHTGIGTPSIKFTGLPISGK
jgi:PmbA protein